MPPNRKHVCCILVLVLLVFCAGRPTVVLGLDHVTLHHEGQEIRIAGRPLVVAQDGGMMLQTRDGTIWLVQPDEVVEHVTDEVAFEPYTAKQLAERLLSELPDGFDVHHTAHYVVCYDTSRAYAQWCGSLFERLYMAFTNYWSKRGFELAEPEFPLVAIVFSERRSYINFARAEVGEAVESVVAYYSLRTNRMVMYDLTGVEARGRSDRRGKTATQINRILAQPGAAPTVATIVHETTHQIAYNCGLHTRFSDCPLWASEGIALFFETPDLKSSRGWRSIGLINRSRLTRFHSYLTRRPSDSLTTLLSDDRRLRDTKQAPDAYAEAWTLTYFLIHHYPEQYITYLKLLSEKKPQHWDNAARRLADFKQAFGEDLEKLDREFLRYMGQLR